jgi:hypothetical protein
VDSKTRAAAPMHRLQKPDNERNVMNKNIMDIVERFQTRHALQEEREMKDFHAWTNGAPTEGVPDKNATLGNGVFETQKASIRRKSQSMEKKQNEHS